MNKFDKVIIKKSSRGGGWNDKMRELRDNKIYGVVVTDCISDTDPEINQWTVKVTFLPESGAWYYFFKQVDLEVIDMNDFASYEKGNAEYAKKNCAEALEVIEKLLTPTQTNYQSIDTNVPVEQIRGYNFMTAYVYVELKNSTGVHPVWPGDCCDFIKQDQDFNYYIPLYYLNWYKYSVYDLYKWLQFISNCNIDFQYNLVGEVGIPDSVKDNVIFDKELEYNSVGLFALPSKRTKFIKIEVKNAGHNWMAYLHLLLIRYIHQSKNSWYIPALAMQIKDELQEEVSCWQALLMAHFHKSYVNERSLVDKGRGLIDIFVDQKTVLANIKKDSKMMQSFKYFPERQSDYPQCKELIEKKQYRELLTFLKTSKL